MNSLRTKIINRRIAQNTIMQLQALSISSEIKIPLRKERGPTDILEALETTISRDPTAPDYKYIDDPFLIPSSLSEKRMYSLSRESGKRAAMWILQEHADLLKSDLSEPLVQAFLPPEKYENKDQVSEEILFGLIKQGRVADAMHVYHLLEKDVSNDAKQAVLEMLCFYNSRDDQIPEEFIEERSYQPEEEISKNMWRNNPNIDKIFEELSNDKTTAAAAYNALICGTAKYLKADKAWQLYQDCLTKNIPLSVTTYNYIIQLTPLLKDKIQEHKVLILTLLQNMAKDGVKPNLGTLNAALKSVSTFSSQGAAKELALSLIAEFEGLGIEPGLAAYYYILLIFCRENCPTSHILNDILDKLEKKDGLEMQDVADKNFFVQAMETASQHMQDVKTGDRIQKLLWSKKNYKLIGGRMKESVYYRNYLQLVLNSETIDDFMKVYAALVPNIYIPEPAVMRDILEMLRLNERAKAIELLPRFLSEVVAFGMLDRHLIMKLMLDLLTTHCAPKKDAPENQSYANMADTLWKHIQFTSERRMQRSMWPSSVFADMAVLQLRGGEFEKMLEILDYLVKTQDSIIGSIDPKRLREIFEGCLLRGHVEGALRALQYAYDYQFRDVNSMAMSIKETLPLSETQENQLINIVGVESLKKPSYQSKAA